LKEFPGDVPSGGVTPPKELTDRFRAYLGRSALKFL
jgi:hypothetical protein